MGIKETPNGNFVLSVRITLRPGRDDDLIELAANAPRGALAGIVRESMRNGVSKHEAVFEAPTDENPLDMAGLGMEI